MVESFTPVYHSRVIAGTRTLHEPEVALETPDIRNRPLQLEGFNLLRDVHRRKMSAPMGIGKSMLMRALSEVDLQKGYNVLISVPQRSIAQTSFRKTYLIMPDGQQIEWVPGRWLIHGSTEGDLHDSTSSIEALIDFLTGPPRLSKMNRVAVCTHQTYTLAMAQIIEARRKITPTSVFIDECHGVRTEDEPVDSEDEWDTNKLGRAVTHWLKEDCGPLTMVSATMMRGDLRKILTSEQDRTFTKWRVTFDEYLAQMRHIKELTFSYFVGDRAEVVRYVFEQHPETCGVLFSRNVSQIQAASNKYTYTDEFLTASLGPYRVDDSKLINHHPHHTSMDLVDDRNLNLRDKKVEELSRGRVPDLVVPIGLCIAGFDVPKWNTCFIDKIRNSFTQMLQMIGRPLRDIPGKRVVHIVFITEPVARTDEYRESIQKNLVGILLAMLLEWQFVAYSPPAGTSKRAVEAVMAFREDEVAQNEVVRKIVQEGIRVSPQTIQEDDKILDRILDEMEIDEVDLRNQEERAAIKKYLLGQLTRQNSTGGEEPSSSGSKTKEENDDLHRYSEVSLPLPGESVISKTLFKLTTSFTGKSLREIRERYEDRLNLKDFTLKVQALNIKTPEEYFKLQPNFPWAPPDPQKYYGGPRSFNWMVVLGRAKPTRRL